MTMVTKVLDMRVKVRGVDVRTPPYQGVQVAARKWAELGDAHITSVVQNGLRLDEVPSFDPVDPADDYKPLSPSPYGRSCSDDDPVLRSGVEKLILPGHVSEASSAEAKCVCSIFLVEKKPDAADPQGFNRRCTNLKPVDWFLSIKYFTLPGLRGILPYVGSDYYAGKNDRKSGYFYMPMLPRDAVWLVFRFKGTL